MPSSVQCSKLPLVKLLLHAAKYPALPVNGVLLGQVEQGGEVVHLTDAVPLFHSSTNLAMPSEVALAMIDTHQCSAPGSSGMLGYYHSEARMQAAELPAVGRKVADKIAAKQGSSVCLLLDNRKLEAWLAGGDPQQHPFELLTRDSRGGWKKEAGSMVSMREGSWAGLYTEVVQLLKGHAQHSLVDFDAHLDDISKDWMNPQLRV